MLRLDRRILRDPHAAVPLARQQACVVHDGRGLVIQWTEDGTWYHAGEPGFLYRTPEIRFGFLANVGGAPADQGRSADGRVFVLLYGLVERWAKQGWMSAPVVRRMASDIETAMMLWPALVPEGLTRRVFFWFPAAHPILASPWGEIGTLFGVNRAAGRTYADDDVDWLRGRAWEGDIA